MQNFTIGEIDRLRALLEENDVTREILSEVQGLRIPDWCLGAGCIAQTVWNASHGFDLNRNIEDYDLAYFDSTDLSEAGEQRTAQRAREILVGWE